MLHHCTSVLRTAWGMQPIASLVIGSNQSLLRRLLPWISGLLPAASPSKEANVLLR